MYTGYGLKNAIREMAGKNHVTYELNSVKLTDFTRYPYPLFEMLDAPQRAMVFSASAVTFTVSSLGLKRVYDLYNGKLKAKLKETSMNLSQ